MMGMDVLGVVEIGLPDHISGSPRGYRSITTSVANWLYCGQLWRGRVVFLPGEYGMHVLAVNIYILPVLDRERLVLWPLEHHYR